MRAEKSTCSVVFLAKEIIWGYPVPRRLQHDVHGKSAMFHKTVSHEENINERCFNISFFCLESEHVHSGMQRGQCFHTNLLMLSSVDEIKNEWRKL